MRVKPIRKDAGNKESAMKQSPPGAGRSSYELINQDILFGDLHLKSKTTFLDLGCGRGEYAIEAATRGAGTVYGIDLWEEGVAVLRQEASAKGLKNVTGLITDLGGRIPLNDHSINLCFMATVLHDLVRSKVAEKALDQVKRVLTEEGILAVVEFKKVDGPPGPPIGIRLAPEEVEQIVAPYGFVKKRLVEIGPYHYLTMFSF